MNAIILISTLMGLLCASKLINVNTWFDWALAMMAILFFGLAVGACEFRDSYGGELEVETESSFQGTQV